MCSEWNLQEGSKRVRELVGQVCGSRDVSLETVSVSSSCCNKVPTMGGLNRQGFLSSRGWKFKVKVWQMWCGGSPLLPGRGRLLAPSSGGWESSSSGHALLGGHSSTPGAPATASHPQRLPLLVPQALSPEQRPRPALQAAGCECGKDPRGTEVRGLEEHPEKQSAGSRAEQRTSPPAVSGCRRRPPKRAPAPPGSSRPSAHVLLASACRAWRWKRACARSHRNRKDWLFSETHRAPSYRCGRGGRRRWVPVTPPPVRGGAQVSGLRPGPREPRSGRAWSAGSAASAPGEGAAEQGVPGTETQASLSGAGTREAGRCPGRRAYPGARGVPGDRGRAGGRRRAQR